MTTAASPAVLVGAPARRDEQRLTASLAATEGVATDQAFRDWYGERLAAQRCDVTRRPVDELDGWETDRATGNIAHRSGRFFTVEGLRVEPETVQVQPWSQPIIHQDEIGVLGILVKEIDGVLHCLMQAKVEPGNVNGVQISPTVQATRSNYTRVHRGSAVRHLEYFTHPRGGGTGPV